MKVLSELYKIKEFDPTRNFNFSKFGDQCGDFLLIESFPGLWRLRKFLEENRERGKLVLINFEEPNGIFASGLNIQPFEQEFYRILTLCPFTAEWLNQKLGRNIRIPVYFPFNVDYIFPEQEKTIDVVYSGKIASEFVRFIVNTISKFNYSFISMETRRKATHININYEEKMNIFSRSKISVVHNLLFPQKNHLEFAKSVYPDFHDCRAYDKNILTSSEPMVPQLKSRVFEAAFAKSLILCRRDPWNVIERYFTPDEEFIYYEPKNLKQTIKTILADYESYKPIIDKAYDKAVNNYTTTHFFKDFLSDL